MSHGLRLRTAQMQNDQSVISRQTGSSGHDPNGRRPGLIFSQNPVD